MEESKPTARFLIKDLETLKTIADPLRSQILESLIHQPMTVRQVAERLGLAPQKLYYHVKLLESHGLIEVAEKRVVGNIIETVYRSAAASLEIDPSLLSFATEEGQTNIQTTLVAALDATREDIVRSLEARAFEIAHGAQEQPRKMVAQRVFSRIDDARAREFQARLCELIGEFEAADVEDEAAEDGLHAYALTAFMYPRFYYPDLEDEVR